ncbi:MAG: 2-oxo acid dehydrogenase subunit E2, partial [Vicingaceae bacterium]
MATTEVKLPKMGESIKEATVLKWLKQVGDSVEKDEPILEVATDKVDSEIAAPESGILTELLFGENDVVAVGTVIAKMDSAA